MDLWLYIKPDNQIALAVIWTLLALFAAWLSGLIFQSVRVISYRTQLKKLSDVQPLEKLWQERLVEKTKEPANQTQKLMPGDNAESAFSDYRETKGLKEASPIVRHVKAIFDAGWSESQLSSNELINHTANAIFRPTGFLRSILSLFIIIGLLGTLFGLAISLSRLTPLAAGEIQQSNEFIAQGLRQLLGELKSAFAPSIWGILFTIIGVILLALHLHFLAAPTKTLLERITLVVWIPKLLPTTSQKLVETLRLSERQMQRSFEAAEQVAEFAESIESDVGNLKKSISSANKTLSQLSQSSSNINEFANKFVEGVSGLAPFQQELKILYGQMVSDSTIFQKNVSQDIESSAEFQESTIEILKSQHVQLQALLGALQVYEEGYITRRQQMDATLQEVLEQARKAYEQIGERNDEINRAIVTSLGDPLRKDLGEGLTKVEGTLQVQLASLLDRFGTFDAPINQAAKKIEGTFETVVRRTEELTRELHREFLAQNETNQVQLRQLDSLNKQIVDLLAGLTQTSQGQGEQAQKLGGQVSSLAQIIGSLDRGVSELKQVMGAATRKTPEPSAEINGQILAALQQLVRNTSQQGQSSSGSYRNYDPREEQLRRAPTDQWPPRSQSSGVSTPGYQHVSAPGGNETQSPQQESAHQVTQISQSSFPPPASDSEGSTTDAGHAERRSTDARTTAEDHRKPANAGRPMPGTIFSYEEPSPRGSRWKEMTMRLKNLFSRSRRD